MAWVIVLIMLAAALVGTLMGGLIRKLAWTVAALLAVWMAYRAWRS